MDPDSDEAILQMLAAHPGLIQAMRAEADEAVQSARGLFNVSQEWIRWKVDRLTADAKVAMQRVAGDKDRSDVVLFRHYRASQRVFCELIERQKKVGSLFEWNAIQAELLREMEQDRLVRSMPVSLSATPFDARGFLTGLAQRGILLRESRAGGLEATPSTTLTDADRTTIRSNLPALREAVAALTETF